MDEHDLLLRHVTKRGWRYTHYNPPTTPLSGYLKAIKSSSIQITKATWIVERKEGKLKCTHPNYTVHFRNH